jgi:hypothetical protein
VARAAEDLVRYPGDVPDLARDLAEEAVELARNVKQTITRYL